MNDFPSQEHHARNYSISEKTTMGDSIGFVDLQWNTSSVY